VAKVNLEALLAGLGGASGWFCPAGAPIGIRGRRGRAAGGGLAADQRLPRESLSTNLIARSQRQNAAAAPLSRNLGGQAAGGRLWQAAWSLGPRLRIY